MGLSCVATAPLAAQRGPDLDAVVRDMLKARTDAGTAARTLLSTHGQTAEATVVLLVRNGYRATEVARASVAVMRMDGGATTRALRSSGVTARDAAEVAVRALALAPLEAVTALKGAGYSPLDVKDALDGEGVLVDLSCIDRQGYPAPCGNPGGAAAQAMGAVTLTPPNQGWTDSILSIESTNIPPVTILLAGQTLPAVDATSVRVRVRLPSSPKTGPLVMRRDSDGVEGVLAESFAVIAPPAQPGPGLDWLTVATEAAAAAVEDVQAWILGAEFVEDHCSVNAGVALGTAGVLRSSTGFEGRVRTRLEAMGATHAVANAFDRTLREAWDAWASHVLIPGVPIFPALAAWPGPEAPPTPGVPLPLVMLVSIESQGLTSPALSAAVRARLGDAGESAAAQEGVSAFASQIGARFAAWIATAQALKLAGWGSVPSYGPSVPAGPVEDGSCAGKLVLAHTHF